MKNETNLEFSDISSEKYRSYTFPEGEVVINNPVHLNVSESGGHRILDNSNISHYIPPGWIHLQWEAKEGCPNFVK